MQPRRRIGHPSGLLTRRPDTPHEAPSSRSLIDRPDPTGLGGGRAEREVTATEDGIRVTDVWQTREQFETFAAEQIGPLSAEAGFPAPPEITYHDVHNYDSADGLA